MNREQELALIERCLDKFGRNEWTLKAFNENLDSLIG